MTRLNEMNDLAVVLAALALDALLGEPRRWHPLVGFGRWAAAIERRLYGDETGSAARHRLRGGLAVALAIAPWLLLVVLSARLPFAVVVDVLILYGTLGRRSLHEHARAVHAPLLVSALHEARVQVARIVSRDAAALDAEGVARATTESVLENGNDAVFGALFWYLVAGAPGALLYRLANTLDALWGYRTPRYCHFGTAAARLDDVLNFVPARLTALSYALAGQTRTALRCWHRQAPAWDSPNAGPVMAAGAGSLGLRLGGPAPYHGVLELRPDLGEGRPPRADDIPRALDLLDRALLAWLAALALGALWYAR